jgi:GT2 family glycosyltransferase
MFIPQQQDGNYRLFHHNKKYINIARENATMGVMIPKSAVLLLHFRDNQHTVPCLDSLQKALAISKFGIYVISIQSKNNQLIENHPIHPVVITTEQNDGFAWANNELMKRAIKDGYQNCIILNNDTTVEPDFLPPLEKSLEDKNVGMVSPKIYFYPGCEFHHDDYKPEERGKVIWYIGGIIDWGNVYASHWRVDEVDHGQFNQIVETDFISGCCTAITKKTIEEVGFMNEKYFLYNEDADWSLQVKKHGLKLIVNPKSVIYHKNAGSTGGSGSPLQQYYQTRNRFYFGMKYAPLRTKIHLIINAIKGLSDSNKTLRHAAADGLLFRLGFKPNRI